MLYRATWQGREFRIYETDEGLLEVECPKCRREYYSAGQLEVMSGRVTILSPSGESILQCPVDGCGLHLELTGGIAVSAP